MNSTRFQEIAARFQQLRIAVVGDFCLDRYLEIDPSLTEVSIETGLPVYNVTQVRSQPGAAGTVLNNLVALGIGEIHLVGFCGEDGEGYELQRALSALPGVRLDHFVVTPDRRTFTYCKPLVMEPGKPPRELNRLDSKNWTPAPRHIVERFVDSVKTLASNVDAMIVMDQVDIPETGVVTKDLLDALMHLPEGIPVVADSRRGLSGYPPVIYKMNAAELAALTGKPEFQQIDQVKAAASELAKRNHREVIVTMAERGFVGALPDGEVRTVPAMHVRGPIDIVGAGDSVTANVTAGLASGASLHEAMEIAAAASSHVIHQLGTTGTASVEQIAKLIEEPGQ